MARDSWAGTRARIARNTGWNLLGALLPLPVAVLCMPLLIHGLGIERFGVLGIAWMVLGYFGMFDFGLALSTTRFLSAAAARGEQLGVRSLALRSVLLHGILGIAGAVIFALLAPYLAARIFSLPPSLVAETRTALYWLAASVPAIVLTAAFRGVLEGLQRFDLVNLIRVPASMVNYVAPLIALYFGSELPLVVSLIVIARYAVLAVYGFFALRVLPPVSTGSAVAGPSLLRLAAYGGWLTASSLVSPLIIATDRFVIDAAVSATAVAFYVTPYEVITKGWILSASLMAALFPVFSALAETSPSGMRAACRAAELFLLTAAAPAIVLLLGTADLLLGWWLGPEFRAESTTVARLLALGMLVNIVAQVPLTALNAVGRADLTAKIMAVELPFYAAAAWYGATRFGINGVAAVWAARAGVDALVLFTAARFALPKEGEAHRGHRLGAGRIATLCAFLAAAWLTPHALPDAVAARCAVLAVLLAALVVWQWRVLLTQDDRDTFGSLCNRLLKISR
jgi:O-antigen/teichoic acid export membrane protein